MIRNSLFVRLFFSYLVVVGTTLLVLSVALSILASRSSSYGVQRDLLAKGTALASALSREQLIGTRAIPPVVELVDRMVGARVWVTDRQGLIRFASRPPGVLEGYRLEWAAIRDVLTGQPVSNTYFSHRLLRPVVSVAVPIRAETGPVVGAVVLATPLSDLVPALRHLQGLLIYAGLITATLAVLLSLMLSRRISRPLHQMSAVADAMASGDFSRRVNVRGTDEVAALAVSFNRLAGDLGRTLRDLTRAKGQIESVVQNLSEGVMALDQEGTVLRANPACLQLLGLREPIEGKSVAELPWLGVPEALVDVLQTAMEQRMPHEAHIRWGNRHLFVRATPVKESADMAEAGPADLRVPDEAAVEVVGVLRDESEYWRLEQMRRDFVANVSHELRTPLTGIRGFLQAIHEGVVTDPKAIQGYVAIMHQETLRLIRLTNTLLELSRLQSGAVRLNKQMVPIESIVEIAAETLSPRFEEKRLTFSIEAPPGLPMVSADPDRLEQVLLNLIDNAVRHTPEEGRIGVRIQLATRMEAGERAFEKGGAGGNAIDTAAVGGRAGGAENGGAPNAGAVDVDEPRGVGQEIWVEVIDSGSGIPPDELPLVWERFYKVDRSRQKGGTGLGLVIVRELVELHGGRVWARSEVGQGSVFGFSLPVV